VTSKNEARLKTKQFLETEFQVVYFHCHARIYFSQTISLSRKVITDDITAVTLIALNDQSIYFLKSELCLPDIINSSETAIHQIEKDQDYLTIKTEPFIKAASAAFDVL